MAKHYDNKNNLIAELKRSRYRTDAAVSATFTAYMMIACLVLYEDLGFRSERLKKFVNGFYKRLDMYNAGTLTVSGMEKNYLRRLVYM